MSTTISIKKTVELFGKGVKATKDLAAMFKGTEYSSSYQAMKTAFIGEYTGFTTDVKKRPETEVDSIVYQTFDATVKQLQLLFPDRPKGKRKDSFDLSAFIAKVAETLKDKECLTEGIELLKGYLD